MKDDTISRQAAIAHAVPLNLFGREVMMVSVSELENLPSAQPEPIKVSVDREMTEEELTELKKKIADSPVVLLPSAQPEVRPIDYQDCSNAMLKMWMDNVVTDGEYNRIMDKLNAHWGKKDG